ALAFAAIAGVLPGFRSVAQRMIDADSTAVCRAQDEFAVPPRDDIERFTVVRAGRIIPVVGKEIEGGEIVISDGKIQNIGRGIEVPLNAKVIDARDQVVMPGLIQASSRFGMPWYRRSGVHADLRVADEFVATPLQFEGLLNAGFTTVALIPAGVGIPGRAMVIRTAGDDMESRTLVETSYIYISASKADLRDALSKAQAEIDKVDKARKEFEEKQKQAAAKQNQSDTPPQTQPANGNGKGEKPPASQPASQPTSQPAFEPPKINPALQPLVDLLQKKEGVRALIVIDSASDYVQISEVLAEYEIAHDFRVRNGSQCDLHLVLDKLREAKPRMLFNARNHTIPYSVERNPLIRLVAQAGCEVSLLPRGDSASEAGVVLQRIAELVRNGWSRQEALKAVTIHPAKLLGVDKRVGSLEKEKDADLIFLDGDPFAAGTRVRRVMIAGETVHVAEGDEQ
ncbi:MAG: hypothetical protein D6744_17440, partial [Planctomycetota bacterium]